MPSKEIPRTPDEFDAMFRSVIRIGFNWERFHKENWPIEHVTLSTPDLLTRCFMPWYIGEKGQEVAYDDRDAVPMRLCDVPHAMGLLNEERLKDIQDYVDQFHKEKNRIRFAAPTYRLPKEEFFILDRNHRLAALALHPFPFEVTLCCVNGPLEPDCLLDLIHWVPPRKG